MPQTLMARLLQVGGNTSVSQPTHGRRAMARVQSAALPRFAAARILATNSES